MDSIEKQKKTRYLDYLRQRKEELVQDIVYYTKLASNRTIQLEDVEKQIEDKEAELKAITQLELLEDVFNEED